MVAPHSADLNLCGLAPLPGSEERGGCFVDFRYTVFSTLVNLEVYLINVLCSYIFSRFCYSSGSAVFNHQVWIMKRSELNAIPEVKDGHRRVIDYYMISWDKQASCERAGYARVTWRDIFHRPEVRAEINRRLALSDYKARLNLDWILSRLEEIATAVEPIELKGKKASLNFNHISNDAAKLLGEFTITETDRKEKYGRTTREVKYKNVKTADKIMALKEIAVLTGLREEKTKIDIEQSLINELTKRREQIAVIDNGQPDETQPV